MTVAPRKSKVTLWIGVAAAWPITWIGASCETMANTVSNLIDENWVIPNWV